MVERTQTLKEFFYSADRESWTGTSVAFRNGAKCRLLEIDVCNYVINLKMQDAWHRGWNAMQAYLIDGGEITGVIKCPVCGEHRMREDFIRYSGHKTLPGSHDRCKSCREAKRQEKRGEEKQR